MCKLKEVLSTLLTIILIKVYFNYKVILFLLLINCIAKALLSAFLSFFYINF